MGCPTARVKSRSSRTRARPDKSPRPDKVPPAGKPARIFRIFYLVCPVRLAARVAFPVHSSRSHLSEPPFGAPDHAIAPRVSDGNEWSVVRPVVPRHLAG